MDRAVGRTDFARARRILAVELKEKGLTEREIARVIVQNLGMEHVPPGYNDEYVAKDIRKELERYRAFVREDVKEMIDVELRRLEKLWFVHFKNALIGDVDSTKLCLKIMESKRKLMGLDAPTKIDVNFRAALVQQIMVKAITEAEVRAELGDEYVDDLLREAGLAITRNGEDVEDGIVDAEFTEVNHT